MSASPYEYDVCLSFAGEQRAYVRELAAELTRMGVATFYDEYEESNLWGKDLYEHLDSVYRHRARYCLLFVSADYARRLWTSHERRSAQARAFEQSQEYILPVRFDDTEVPGIRPTVGYIDARETKPAELAALVLTKLTALPHPSTTETPAPPAFLTGLADDVRSQTTTQLSLLVGQRSMPVPWQAVTAPDGAPATAGAGAPSLVELLRARRQLVIVGGPGSGKTVMAMLIKKELLASRTATDPVPVRFPLASWNPQVQTLHAWMTRVLRELFPEATSPASDRELSEAVARGRVLPLFDGFDEIRAQLRAHAGSAIEIAMAERAMVLTSRPLPHPNSAPFPTIASATAVRLRPVPAEDTSTYLSAHSGSTAWHRVIDALRSDLPSPLTESLSAPLITWLARTVYSSPTHDDIAALLDPKAFPDQDSIERHLLDRLVPTVFTRAQADPRGDPAEHSAPEDARRWLAFLAAGVRTHGQLGFWTIETLAPKRRLAVALAVLLGCVVGVLATAFLALAVGLCLSLLLGLVFGVAFGRGYSQGRIRGQTRWEETGYSGEVKGTSPDLPTQLRRLGTGSVACLACFLAAAAVFSALRWSGARFGGADATSGIVLPFLLLFVVGLVVTAATGYAGGGLAAVILRAAPRLDRSRTGAQATTPSDAVRKDRSSAVIIGGLSWLVNGTVAAAVLTVLFGLGAATAQGFLSGAGAAVTASTMFSFWARYRPTHAWLAFRGHLPWHLMSFLDEAHRLGVLRQNGLFYEFRHARVQETLADACRAG